MSRVLLFHASFLFFHLGDLSGGHFVARDSSSDLHCDQPPDDQQQGDERQVDKPQYGEMGAVLAQVLTMFSVFPPTVYLGNSENIL